MFPMERILSVIWAVCLRGFQVGSVRISKGLTQSMGTRKLSAAPGRWFIRTKVKASNRTLVAVKWHQWQEHRLVAADIPLCIRALPGRVNNRLCFYICESLHLIFNFSAFAFTPLPVGSLVLRCPLPFIPLFPFLPYYNTRLGSFPFTLETNQLEP